MNTYKCKNCGAEVFFNNGDFATCIYCNHPVTIDYKEFTDFNVKKIVKFNIDKDRAVDIVKDSFIYKGDDPIVSVDKYYIPVRFFNCDFSFYVDYDFVYSTGDDEEKHERRIELINGKIEKEAYILSNQFETMLGFHELKDTELLDFDPVLLENTSCDFASKDVNDTEGLYKTATKTVYNIGNKSFSSTHVGEIYDRNHDIRNLDIDEFTTMFPIYFVKTKSGARYAVAGYVTDKVYKNKKSPWTLILIAFLIFSLWLLGNAEKSHMFIIGFPVTLVIFIGYRVLSKKAALQGHYTGQNYNVLVEDFHERKFDYTL